jgi:glycosyltransferase involved in cell wall biosynthesis
MSEASAGSERSGTQQAPRRVLMLSAVFPPVGGPGVQRSAKFAKYLPDCGWHPTVWSMAGIRGLPRDDTLLRELPEQVALHSIPDQGAVVTTRRSLQKWVDADRAGSRLAAAVDRRLGVLGVHVSFPDVFETWAKRSVAPLRRLIDGQRIDALYSTFSPASNHMLGLILKKRTRLPWIADFRDLWTDDYRYLESSPSRRRAHRRLERRILEAADVVVGVTKRQTEILADRVPHLRHKFVTITNGFDAEDFPEQPDRCCEPTGGFVLAHVGRFDQWRTSDPLLVGLRRFVESLGADRGRFEFRVVGHCARERRARVDEIGAATTFTGYLSHGEAIRAMRAADALLLSVPDGPHADSVIPAKLFEYLAAGRPILVVGPENGAAEELVRKHDAGLIAGLDEFAVARALGELYGAWRSERAHRGCDPRRLRPYSRFELTRKLAGLLDLLIGGDAQEKERVEEPVEVYV